ncbi:acyltransferase family protein [Robiginitomaculum antarcticum]|uniref:acyltransferase family protein n=1 Tax=Robiginitomaculum antarcticum TaxID=437507 RepID=UPI0003A45276|nr:acyltransferase family protein [Robiginitomaculum antarcticum]
MQSSVAKTDLKQSPRSAGVAIVRMGVVSLVAFGYISTMARGPGTEEYGRIFGLDPSWHGMNVLFILAGFFALKTLYTHGSAWLMLKSRTKNNLLPVAMFAFAVVAIIYPLLGSPAATPIDTAVRLSLYVLRLITFLDPGAILPGLMDDAKYMGSIQGAIWTLRWGAIAYIGTALAWQIGIFKRSGFVISASLAVLILYMLGLQNYISNWVQTPEFIQAPLRLGTMFMLGAGAFAYCQSIKTPKFRQLVIAGFTLIALTAFQFYVLPWTPLIEVIAAIAFAMLAGALSLYIDTTALKSKSITDISIWIFLIHWPAAQLILLASPNLSSWQLITITLPVTFILSVIMTALLSSIKTYRRTQSQTVKV